MTDTERAMAAAQVAWARRLRPYTMAEHDAYCCDFGDDPLADVAREMALELERRESEPVAWGGLLAVLAGVVAFWAVAVWGAIWLLT